MIAGIKFETFRHYKISSNSTCQLKTFRKFARERRKKRENLFSVISRFSWANKIVFHNRQLWLLLNFFKLEITMTKKIFLLGICAFALVCNAFSQDKMMDKKDSMMSKNMTAEEVAKTALTVGAAMPSFNLKDAKGNSVASDDLLKQGNLVVVFYRGAWCPFCNLYLRNLQQNLPQIKENGGNLVAISVENPDNSMKVAQKNNVEFTVLSDPNLDVARKFGIVYQLSPETDAQYKGYGIDLVKQNGTAKPELPLSATYIVNKKGEIVYSYLEPDYKKRAEPSVLIETLKKMKADSMMDKKMDDKMDKKMDDKMDMKKDEKMSKKKDKMKKKN
jgi:peroxiredoxin